MMSMSNSLSYILVLLYTLQGADAISYKTFNANLNAAVIVLDAASLEYPGTHAPRPLVASPDACRDICKKVSGCNGYTYCNKQSGCASGCRAYVQQHPTLQLGSNPEVPDNTKLPILSFGPWSSLCNGDAWPYGMCTLKTSSNPSSPKFWSANAADGWVSGTIIMPGKCKGVSAITCDACLKSASVDGCVKCAKSVPQQRIQQIKGDIGLLVDGCPYCYKGISGKTRSRCLDCLTKNKPCGKCASLARQPHTVQLCLSCYQSQPAAAQISCLDCGNIANAAQAKKCATDCVPKLRKTWCTKAQEGVFTGRRPLCTSSYRSSCASCATSSNYGTCVKCLVTRPGSSDCGSCTVVKKSQQSQCYNCALSTYAQYSPCSDCISFGNGNKCIACVKDPKVSYEAKSWCSGCGNWYSTAAKQQECYNCLKQKHSDYLNACSRL